MSVSVYVHASMLVWPVNYSLDMSTLLTNFTTLTSYEQSCRCHEKGRRCQTLLSYHWSSPKFFKLNWLIDPDFISAAPGVQLRQGTKEPEGLIFLKLIHGTKH